MPNKAHPMTVQVKTKNGREKAWFPWEMNVLCHRASSDANVGVSDFFSDHAQLKMTTKASANHSLPGKCNCWLLLEMEHESWFYTSLI
jgi:hypothetical protein